MKRIYALMIVLLAGWLISCNPVDEDTSGGSSVSTGGGKVASGNGDAGEASTEPIKLGFNLELTGNAATFGLSAQAGAEIALEELNAAGGVLGRQIEAVFDDNQSMPDPAAKVASKLINLDKVDVLLGAVASSQSIAMAKIAEEAGVPMVTPASTSVDVTVDRSKVRKYVFRTCFTDDFQGEGIVDFAVNGPIAAKTAVIFYDAENDYSVGIYETVKAVAPEFGLAIIAEDSYLGTSETDFRSKLNKFKGHEFDVIIVPGYYNQVGLIANQAREVGLAQPLLGGDGFDSPELFKVAGKNITGSYFTNHYASDDMDPAVQGYIRKYKEHFGGKAPDAMSILCYDAVMVVADAIERAGGTGSEALVAALASVSGFKGAAGTITINEQHNATKKLVVLEIGEDGGFSWVYTYDPLATDEEPVVEKEAAAGEAEDEAVDEGEVEEAAEVEAAEDREVGNG